MKRENLVMMFIMTILMGIAMSAVFTWQIFGFAAGFISLWAGRFITTWPIVIPIVLIAAPVAQWITRWLVSNKEEQ
jgi:Zn-dependent protease with chaperone function